MDDFDLMIRLSELQGQLATAKRDAVEAFYDAVMARCERGAGAWDALEVEMARIREGQ